jgi:hypothetical protein
MLIAGGSVGILIGLIISTTLVGAICGIPIVIVSIVMTIQGYLMKAKDQAIKDEKFSERMLQTQAVASGVNICHRCKAANARTNPECANCGQPFMRIGDPQPISAIDPTEVALRAKQTKGEDTKLWEEEG